VVRPSRLAFGVRHRPGGPDQAGFSLLEMLVATVVLMVALLIACDLLDESARVLHHSGRRARDPWPLLGSELLRNDLRAALPPALGWEEEEENDWLFGPLALELPGVGDVTWQVVDAALHRVHPAGDRVVLQGVLEWRWRPQRADALEVELTVRRSDDWVSHAGRVRPRIDSGRRERLRFLVTSRGGTESW
jgi:hypothetical protein